jgi:hypothetical protein
MVIEQISALIDDLNAPLTKALYSTPWLAAGKFT